MSAAQAEERLAKLLLVELLGAMAEDEDGLDGTPAPGVRTGPARRADERRAVPVGKAG